ncbi:hypothetical protein ACF087_35305 [Streptomyces goshikiensis]|uniref:hypothetical protein n=1 Tax=Streptomyces goshikiensis TaxID=1942 RepID=UPI0036F90EB7
MPIKQIARHKHLAPNTVRRLLRSERPPRYQRPPRPSVAAPFEPLILPLLRREPALSAAEIARHIDWPASASLLRSHVARLRATLPRMNPQPVFQPAAVLVDPGWAECGLWWPKTEITVWHGQVRRCPVLLMVAGASRRLTARLLPSSRFRDVWIGHRSQLQEWGAVPHTLRWDTEGIESPWYFNRVGWDISWDAYVARAELDDVTIQHVGVPLPGLAAARRRLRQYRWTGQSIAPDSFAADLMSWVESANETTGSRPVSWQQERSAMVALTATPELLGIRSQGWVTPSDDGFVAIAGNHYLVGAWGARRKLTVDITDTTVTIRSSGYHAGGFHVLTYVRSWAADVHLTDPQQHVVTHSGTRSEVQGP